MMSYEEAIAYVLDTAGKGVKDDTRNMLKLMERLGNPQNAYPCVHIAGTNGKGSVASMIARSLSEHGLRAGLYTSPHLVRFNERIRVDGRNIDDKAFAWAVSRVAEEVTALRERGVKPTFFEVITAVAFTHFRESGVDYAVIETGLGGRLDATNIITPELIVIGRIGLDHVKTLGESLQLIAGEKAGIFKRGVPVILHPQEPEAADVLTARAEALSCPVVNLGDSRIEGIETSLAGTVFDLTHRGAFYPHLFTRLAGRHQAANAAAAFIALCTLSARGATLSERTIRTGIAWAKWPCRMESIEGFLLDGAHNPQAAQALCENLRELLSEKPLFIAGVMADKDVGGIVAHFSRCASEVYAVAVDHPRAMSPGDLADTFRKQGVPAVPYASVEQAVGAARHQARPVVVAGSLYLAGAVRGMLAGSDVHLI